MQDEKEDRDTSIVSENTDSLYLPTPQRNWAENVKPITVPKKLFVGSLTEVDTFIKMINEIRCCVTPGCKGQLVPLSFDTKGLGGAVKIYYGCDGCDTSPVCFESSLKSESLTSSEIGAAIQVGFIISGCMHATYCKVLKLSLGLDSVCWDSFYSTITRMYPVVKEMVDEMCEEAKEEMKAMEEDTLGSWKNAVTSADATWMTRGRHSKNGTFSVRNYYNGALLYYQHLCQRGRDDIVGGELYKGTSKSMEGFAAREVMNRAREEGMKLAVHWQDSDSSSAKPVAENFPECKVMICGGHAGRAHLKALEKYSKVKKPSARFIKMHKRKFPQINEVTCPCSQHKAGCGCLTDAFIARARNNFSHILTDSKSAEEFAKRLRVLPRHVRDEHEWEEVKEEGAEPTREHCDFHPLKVCSCGNCADKENFECEGRDYATWYRLACPFHSLVYEIECDYRASMADCLVHPVLKRGHSNWLEASHNVFIRFRSKDISLERLHYEVSTNLGLLQSNMTYMYEKRGRNYHWIPDLYKRLNLPVYEGIQEAVTTSNIKRRQQLGRTKQEKVKKRRMQLLKLRTKEAAERREWSKKHGGDTYGETEDRDSKAPEKKKGSKAPEKKKGSVKQCPRCGSATHSRSTYRGCPYNSKYSNVLNIDNSEDMVCDKGDVVYTAKDQDTDDADTRTMLSDDELSFSDSSLEEDYLEDSMIYHDDEPECTCGAEGKGHKRDCPLNPYCLYRAKPATSTPVRPPTSAPFKDRKRSSLRVHVFPPAKKGKLSASCSTMQSARELADSSLSPKEGVYCICRGRDEGDMVQCDGRSCTFQWFHFECVGITEAPEGKWYCDDCSQELNIDDSCVEFIDESPATVTVTGPLPTEEWKSAARDVIAKLSRCELTARSQ